MKIEAKYIKDQKIHLIAKENEKHLWYLFHPWHYMTASKDPKKSFPTAAKMYTFYWVKDNEEILVGSVGVLFQIASFKAKRLTRVVVLPEFQGLGFSSKMINSISDMYSRKGFKVFIGTLHPRLGAYLSNSRLWSPLGNNQKEFCKTKSSDETLKKFAVKNTRDGVKMYRFWYSGVYGNYELIYNPIEIDEIKKKIKTSKDPDEISSLQLELQKIKDVYNADERFKKPLNLLSDRENEEYKMKYKRVKRKPLTPEERKIKKAELNAKKAKKA